MKFISDRATERENATIPPTDTSMFNNDCDNEPMLTRDFLFIEETLVVGVLVGSLIVYLIKQSSIE